MPYIKQNIRDYFEKAIEDLDPDSDGDLNYIITKICLNYVLDLNESYDAYNAVIGVLECAKQEFYRRAVAPYEDKKIEENGDVY